VLGAEALRGNPGGGDFNGAILQLPDQNNYALTNFVAGTQMWQIRKDEEPKDLSKEGNEMAFTRIYLHRWRPMQNDKNMKRYGYVDITSTPGVA
jgi:hypothetical protein